MQRQGYKEDFNKETLTDESIAQDLYERQERTEKYHDLRGKLLVNGIEFLVGVVLLVFCYMYLQSHPAEKTSLFSGIEVIVQKAKIVYTDLTGGNGQDIQAKYQMEQTYNEIVSMALGSECLSANDVEEVQALSVSLKNLSVEEYLQLERRFANKANEYFRKVRNACSNG